MLPSNEDKKMLIQSMKKLTHHISNNNSRQRQIFESLSQNDLLKIVSNLSDDNEQKIQEEYQDYFQLNYFIIMIKLNLNLSKCQIYSHNKAEYILQFIISQIIQICLNQLPITIQKFPSTLKKCIQLMKSPIKQQQKDKFCWTINLDRKILQIQFLQYKKYSSFTFLDPSRNIFGFTYTNDNKFNLINSNILNNRTIQRPSRQRSNNSIDSNISNSKRDTMTNSGFYKNYLQTRTRKHQSPSSSYRQYYQKKQIIKLNTPKQNKQQNNSSYLYNNSYTNNINLNSSINKNNKIMASSSKYTPNDRQLYEKSITTPVKHKDYNLKLDISSLNQSLKLNSYTDIKNIGNQSQRDSGLSSNSYRAPQTDRKNQSPGYKMMDSGLFNKNNTLTQKYKFPQSTKNTYISQHQKFYKKVKQILKR